MPAIADINQLDLNHRFAIENYLKWRFKERLVSEYWIVNLQEESVFVYYLNKEDHYVVSKPNLVEELLNSLVLPTFQINATIIFQE